MNDARRLEELRAARLHRQRRPSGLDALVRDTIGLHSTDYGTPYLSVRARLPELPPSVLADRLERADGLVRLNAFRNTVHVVHTDDLGLVSAATGAAVASTGRRSPGLKGRSDAEIQRGCDALVGALEGGPLGTHELKAALPELAPDLRYWLLVAMGSGRVLRTAGAHPRSNRTRYVLATDRVPGYRPGDIAPADARRALLLRAVRAFGPLTVEDLAWWLPASKAEVKAALGSAGAEIASIEAEGRTFWFTSELADEDAPARQTHGAWALPYEDALLKGYKDRGWCLAPGLAGVVFPTNVAHWQPPDGADPGPGPHKGVNVSGEARPTLWWEGRVVGRWEERKDGVVWQLHADLGREGTLALSAEVERVERFLEVAFADGVQG